MADAYDENPDALARLYAAKIAAGFGPAAARKLERDLDDARVAGDRRRLQFWERVRRRMGDASPTPRH
jgi:hypothetical protein